MINNVNFYMLRSKTKVNSWGIQDNTTSSHKSTASKSSIKLTRTQLQVRVPVPAERSLIPTQYSMHCITLIPPTTFRPNYQYSSRHRSKNMQTSTKILLTTHLAWRSSHALFLISWTRHPTSRDVLLLGKPR
jgi:hypothetical protein